MSLLHDVWGLRWKTQRLGAGICLVVDSGGHPAWASPCRKGGTESRPWSFCVALGLTMSGVPLLCVVVCPNTLFL